MGDFRLTAKGTLEQFGYQNGYSSRGTFTEIYGNLFSKERSVVVYDARGNRSTQTVESEYEKLQHLSGLLDLLSRNVEADAEAANRQSNASLGEEGLYSAEVEDFEDDIELAADMDDAIACATELLESVDRKLADGRVSDADYIRLCNVRAELAVCVTSLSNIRVTEQLDRFNKRYEATMEEQPSLSAQFDAIEKRGEEIRQEWMEDEIEDDRASVYQAGMENVGADLNAGEKYVSDTRDFFLTFALEDPLELLTEIDGEITTYENLKVENAKLYFPNVETAGLVELEEKISSFHVTTPSEANAKKERYKNAAAEKVKIQLLETLPDSREALKLAREFQKQAESSATYRDMEIFFDQYVENNPLLRSGDPGKLSRARRAFVDGFIGMHADMRRVDETAQQEAKALDEMRAQATLTSLKVKRAYIIQKQPQVYDKFMEDKIAQARDCSEVALREQLGKMLRDINKYHKGLLNSTEYSDFKKALEKAATTGDLEELSRKTNAYVAAKVASGGGVKTGAGQGRLAIAKNVKQLLDGYLQTKAAMQEDVERASRLNKRHAEIRQPAVDPLERINQKGHEAQSKLKEFYKKKAFHPNELKDVKEAVLDSLMRKYVAIMSGVEEGKKMLDQCRRDPKFAEEALMAARNMMSQRLLGNDALITPANIKLLDKTNLITAISKGSIIFNPPAGKNALSGNQLGRQTEQKAPAGMSLNHD